MKNILKKIALGIVIMVVFFGSLELGFRMFVPAGSYDFIERCIFEQGLKFKKQKGEYRIFLYGESTMQGSQLYPKSTIDKWMDIYFEQLLGKAAAKNINVVNFARLGEHSGFIAKTFSDTIAYKPDLAVFYSVHNDFIQLENRKFHLGARNRKDRMKDLGSIALKSSFINAVRRAFLKMKLARRQKKEARDRSHERWHDETKKRHHDPNADLFRPGSAEFKVARDIWQGNINGIIEKAKKNKITAIFLAGVCKMKHYEPFKSVHKLSLAEQDLKEWNTLDELAAKDFESGEYKAALEIYSKCLKLDCQYALTYYRMAQCCEALGRFDDARFLYAISNDWDCFPVRAPSCVNRFYNRIKNSNIEDIYVIDAQGIFEKNSPNGIIDDELILDQIHPTMEGQALMALETIKVIYENNLLGNKYKWDWNNIKLPEELKGRLNLDEDFEFDMYTYSAFYVGSYYERAVEYLEKAYRLKPQSILARSQLAWTYLQVGRKEDAIKLYKGLYKDAPQETLKFLERNPQLKKEILD